LHRFVATHSIRRDESLRIVSEELWERVQQRLGPALHDARLKSGGKPKYMLCGLLRCGQCDAHYVITNQREYGCASFSDGHACSNSIRVRRDSVEAILLDPIRKDLLAPERVERMGAEMQAQYREETRAMHKRWSGAPVELVELNARLSRLRERLVNGDPDMALDEIQAAIDRAEADAGSWSALRADPARVSRPCLVLEPLRPSAQDRSIRSLLQSRARSQRIVGDDSGRSRRPCFTTSHRSAAVLLASSLSRSVPHTSRRLISNSP
jgi:hypothetical protein